MKPFSVKENTEALSISFQMESLPFYFNQGKINVFALFINFLFLSVINYMFIPNLIDNNYSLCASDSDSEESSLNSDNSYMSDSTHAKWFEKSEKLSDTFIENINSFTAVKNDFLQNTIYSDAAFIEGAKNQVQKEFEFKKEFDIFVEKGQMPSYLLRECYNRLFISLESGSMALNHLENKMQNTDTTSNSCLKNVKILKSLNKKLLEDLGEFKTNYSWSDSGNSSSESKEN